MFDYVTDKEGPREEASSFIQAKQYIVALNRAERKT